MIFKNANHLKNFLKNESARLDIRISNVYSTFFARNLLSIISKYPFDDIVVKGSFSQFVHTQKIWRPVTDVDIASRSNIHLLMQLINNTIKDDDGQIHYAFSNKNEITNTGIYKKSIIASFDGIHQQINLDLKADHPCILETPLKFVPPIFQGDEPFLIHTPSFEEHLAEKLCIIAETNKPDVLNTRLKDFYDIYQLHGGKYDPEKLSRYFAIILRKRAKINLEEVTTEHLDTRFISMHQEEWKKSRHIYEFMDFETNLTQVVSYSRAVLSEQLQKLRIIKEKQTKKGKIYYLAKKQ